MAHVTKGKVNPRTLKTTGMRRPAVRLRPHLTHAELSILFATLYDVVGSVKRHEGFASHAAGLLFT